MRRTEKTDAPAAPLNPAREPQLVNLALLSAAHVHTKVFLKNIADHDDRSLVVIYDDIADRGQRFAADNNAEFSADLTAVLARDDVDGFIICSENTRHLDLLQTAIPAGKPIFCEKPFTTAADEAFTALELVRKHGTIVHMGYFQPFSAPMQGAIAHVASGALGNITHAHYRNAHHAAYGRWFDSPDVNWFTRPELAGGGAFMDMGSVLGKVDSVMATIGNAAGIYPDVDDHGIAWLRFANGALGTVEASWVQTGGHGGGFEITGSEGTLFEHADKGYLVAVPGQDPQPVTEGAARPTQVDRLVAAVKGDLSHEELDADLLCAIDAVATMEACYESNRTGRWVQVRNA
jgi:predicted dehydrogenase